MGQPAGPPGPAAAFSIGFGEPLPLQDYYALIDAHHALRVTRSASRRELARLAHQFRAVQKRVLARYKTSTAANAPGASSASSGPGGAMGSLLMLLERTHDELGAAVRRIARCESRLRAARNRLSCGTRLMLALMQLRFGLDEASARTLAAYMLPDAAACTADDAVGDGDEAAGGGAGAGVGFEEMVDANLMYLLRTQLSTKAGAGAGADADADAGARHPVIAPLHDVDKLKRHISIVCERLSRGGVRLR